MKVAIPDYVLVQNLNDESVLLNMNTETYFGLDDVASQMWEVLKTSDSTESALEKLITIYDAPKDTLSQDLLEFINKLSEHELLEIVEN